MAGGCRRGPCLLMRTLPSWGLCSGHLLSSPDSHLPSSLVYHPPKDRTKLVSDVLPLTEG